MQQKKKEHSKGKRKRYSEEELTALGIYKDTGESTDDGEDDSKE